MARTLVIALGLLSVFGLLEALFVLIQSPAINGRIFSGPQGELLLHSLSVVPSLLAAIGTGILTAAVLRGRGAVWVLLTISAAYAASHYFGIQYFQKPDIQQRIVQVVQALMILLLPSVAFVIARRAFPWSRACL